MNIWSLVDQKIQTSHMPSEKLYKKNLKTDKTFVFQKEETGQSEMLNWSILGNSPAVDLKPLVQKIANPQNKQFKIYSPQQDDYIAFQQICLEPFIIPKQHLELQIIMIRYADYQGTPLQESNPSDQDQKKQRSRQRTIKEVIELVSKWRQLHSSTQNGKRINLQEAARIVGVSKKSLDDYYYQLRVGQKHQFDFRSHLQDKIGVLRAFIKQKQPQRKNKQKHAKHPKKLKIIQDFAEKLQFKQIIQETPPKHQYKEVSDNCSLGQNSVGFMGNFWANPYESISRQVMLDCQNNFLNEFRNQLDEPDDPFVFLLTNRVSDSQNPFL